MMEISQSKAQVATLGNSLMKIPLGEGNDFESASQQSHRHAGRGNEVLEG